VAVVDDHPVFRLGLRQALRAHKGIEVLWDAATVEDAFQLLTATRVDMVLMDAALTTKDDGIAATRRIIRKWPEVAVVVLSASLDDQVRADSLGAGASAYLSKQLSPEEIVRALRQVAVERRAQSVPPLPVRASRGLGALTRREQDVLAAMRLGYTNREIAGYLGLSRTTINKHVHEILTKLNARNRVQAVTMLAKLGAGS
jgi:DNA-binding NarL/FixJ family response regulator